MIRHSITCMVLGMLIGMLLVGAAIVDVREAQGHEAVPRTVTLTQKEMWVLKRLALKGCGVRTLHEDGTGTVEHDDDIRTMCQEWVGQVGR